MNPFEFESLLGRMAAWEEEAFAKFDDVMRHHIIERLRDLGLSESELLTEAPRCLLALGILAVQRRAEIRPGEFLVWCRIQTRNITIRHFRDEDDRMPHRAVLTARRARELAMRLDGTRKIYKRAARKLGVLTGWLRRRHQAVLARYHGILSGRPRARTVHSTAPTPAATIRAVEVDL